MFALVNRAVPQRLALWGMDRFLGATPSRVFPAHYDKCWDSALRRLMFAGWSEVRDRAAVHGRRVPRFVQVRLQALYLGAEEWWTRRDMRNLAAYYIITAVK